LAIIKETGIDKKSRVSISRKSNGTITPAQLDEMEENGG
jgi:hypothetical protein